MRRPVLLVVIAAATAACDSKPTTTITIDTIGPPDLVAFRLGTGDWQTLTSEGNELELEVDEPYVVAVACNDVEGLFDTYQFARTPDDGREITAPCTGNGPPLDGAVQGTLVQTGEVLVGFTSQSVPGPNGTFDVEASAGTHELVALTDTHVAVRRGIQVAGATAITPAIDVETEGAARVPAGFTFGSIAPDESAFAFARLLTENDTFVIVGFGDPGELQLAPDAALAAEDRQLVNIQIARGDLARSVLVADARSATPRAITLPEYLSGATLAEAGGTISATWGALPDHDTLLLTIDQQRDDQAAFLFHELEISKAYAEAMGTNIALDLAIPGFDSAGLLDVTKQYSRSFEAIKQRDGGSASSRLSETLNRPTARPGRAASTDSGEQAFAGLGPRAAHRKLRHDR